MVYSTTTIRTAASPSFLGFVHSELNCTHTPHLTCRWPKFSFDRVVKPAVHVDFAEFCCVFFCGRHSFLLFHLLEFKNVSTVTFCFNLVLHSARTCVRACGA